MPLVNMKDMLQHAYQHAYAVAAFEVVSQDFLQATIQAAEKAHAPVILNLSATHNERVDFELMMAAAEAAAKRASIPVAIHFDHASNLASVINGIKHGCNGVMIDTSQLDLATNIQKTCDVVETATTCGIPVEGSLGCIHGMQSSHADGEPDENIYTSVTDTKTYVERTKVDFLAVSIGTVHGSSKDIAQLDYSRLQQINTAAGIPLVIHGGSGLSAEQCASLATNGVAKINCYTALTNAAAEQLRNNVKTQSTSDYLDLSKDVIENIASAAEHAIRLCGAAGRADDVLAHSTPWMPVEHLIIYNVEQQNPRDTENMIAEGKRVLSAIPGVREVVTGVAVQTDAAYQYTWLVRFCHTNVIESYKHHPDHVAFADNHFRPVAGNRISIDYQAIEPALSQL